MLKRLVLENCFAHKFLEIDFERGLTSIAGPNGIGKSLVIEMIRYALFGTKACRGPAADYVKVKVQLDFELQGAAFRVRREGSKVELARDGDALAAGTTAVNAKIVELFGYGLEVFDMTNAINQGQIEAMGAMKPADRKRLVDSTIGLDTVDVLADWCNTLSTTARRAADRLRETAQEPVCPAEPPGYLQTPVLQGLLDGLRAIRDQHQQIEGWLAIDKEPPVAPVPPCAESADELREKVDARVGGVARRKAITDQIQALPIATHTTEQLDAEQGLLDACAIFQARGPRPSLSHHEVAHALAQWDGHEAWLRRQELEAQGYHQCPECQHEWPVAGTLPDAVPIDKPAHDRATLAREAARLEAWQEYNVLRPDPERPTLTQKQITAARAAAAHAERLQALRDELTALVLPEDVTDLWKRRTAYERDLEIYEGACEEYEQWILQRLVKLRDRDALATRLGEIAPIEARLVEAQRYELDKAIYDRDSLTWEKTLAELARLDEEADQYKRAAGAMKDVKGRVKSFLVPSLSRVASFLIRTMTAGQPQELGYVEVSEDFDILVDHKPLDRLNGSGKAVTNLAVRIGLGQVLTHKAFPVLMCDEVDAGCDDERAAAIADSLRALDKSIAQIVVVSHKPIAADNYISLLGS